MPEYGEGYVLKESLIILTEWDNDIEKWVILDDDLEFLMTEKNDVAPVVHAYWRGIEGDGYDPEGNIVWDTFECSNCGKEHYADGEPEWDYCPQCGARMDGED